MKKALKSLLLVMILVLSFSMCASAAVKKITITKPTNKATATYTLTAKEPTKSFKLQWTLKTAGTTKNTVSIKTSNKNVVAVKKLTETSAQITLKKAGKATITVYNGKVKDTLKITVKQNAVSITPKEQYVFVQKGKSTTLKQTVLPSTTSNKKVTYKTSNKAIATVNAGGKVTGKKEGTAVITIKAKDGSGVSTKVYVTVGTKTTKVTKVTVKAGTTKLYPGQTTTIKATVAPANATNKQVRYESNKTSVATVSSKGVVTAKAPGSVVINTIANDGSKKNAKLTFTVLQPVTEIKLNTTKMTLCTEAGRGYETSASLTASAMPSNAANKGLTITSSNKAVADYVNGKVVAKAPGSCVITVKANDGQGAVAKCNVTVKAVNKKVLSVDTSKFHTEYKVGTTIAWADTAKVKTAIDELVCFAPKTSYTIRCNDAKYEVYIDGNGLRVEDESGKDRTKEFYQGTLVTGTVTRTIVPDRFMRLLGEAEEMMNKVTLEKSLGNALVTTGTTKFEIKNVTLNSNNFVFMMDGEKVTATLSNGTFIVKSTGSLDKAVAAVSACLGDTLNVQ